MSKPLLNVPAALRLVVGHRLIPAP